MKDGSSMVKAVGLGAIALLFLFLGREAPMNLAESLFDFDIPTKEQVEEREDTESISTFDNGQVYQVEQVIDGDTFRVTISGVSESVRVLGINTPETEYSSRGAECFGKEASAYAKMLLKDTEVTLTPDDSQDTRDKYNRILAYVTLPDGSDYGEMMIANGYAYEYTFKGRQYEKQDEYKGAQDKAEERGVGLWERCGK